MLQALLADAAPRLIAKPGEWDMAHEGAPADEVLIAVHHIAMSAPLPAMWSDRLARFAGAAQLLAVYQQTNGAALFCTDPSDEWSAGFLFLPAQQWEEARVEMVDWLTCVDFQDAPESLPEWVRSAIAFGKIPGDASYWMLPVEGPFAGRVLLSNDDVSAETPRYPCFDNFVATLRVQPQKILGSGGYISYPVPGKSYLLYPVGYQPQTM